MKRVEFRKAVREKILVFDGAMGTELQKYGMKKGACPEELNLVNKELILRVNKSYVEAGSDIIETNTFGGNRLKLKPYNLEHKVKDVNKYAVAIAKEAIGNKKVLVAGSVGPTGELLYPEGNLTIDEAYDIFYEQMKALYDGGADLFIIETITDIEEYKIAVRAAQEFNIGLVAQMTFTEGTRTLTGSTPEILCTVAEGLDVDVVGVNCSAGPEGLYPVIERMCNFTKLPVSIQANAGIPYIKNGETIFPASPELMADYAEKFYNLGVNIIGGCCGTTPNHISEIVKRVKHKKVLSRNKTVTGGRVASRSRLVLYGSEHPVVLVGERLNPTGKKKLTAALKNNQPGYVVDIAKKQENEGANVLDVNVGVPDVDEKSLMKNILEIVQATTQLPIMIDSSFVDVLKSNLKYIYGKGIINSINGKKKNLEEMMPVVKKYGFSTIALTLDEKGIPETAVERMKIVEKFVRYFEDYNIDLSHLIIDAITLTVSSNPAGAKETLKTIEMIKKEFNIATSLGISNISFGLPNREIVNSAYFAAAIMSGLDMVIMNPASELMKQIKLASDLLSQRDVGAKNFLQFSKSLSLTDNQVNIKASEHENKKKKDKLYDAVLNGDKENIVSYVKEKESEFKPLDIINNFLIPAITEVGDLYDKGIYFLPQLIQSAGAMEKAVNYIKTKFPKNQKKKATLVICTVEGDIHSIGKNIVKMLLENYGYNVIDLGVNVNYEKLKSVLQKENPAVVLLSALMTTTMINMEVIIKNMRQDNFNMPVLIGGAVVNQEYADKIGAIYAGDAINTVKVIEELIN